MEMEMQKKEKQNQRERESWKSNFVQLLDAPTRTPSDRNDRYQLKQRGTEQREQNTPDKVQSMSGTVHPFTEPMIFG